MLEVMFIQLLNLLLERYYVYLHSTFLISP